MKRFYISTFIIFIALLLLLFSCAKPQISNLKRGMYNYKTTTSDILDVSVSVLPLPSVIEVKQEQKNFFDLRDSLPHLFLKIMASKTKTPKELIDVLKEPLSKENAIVPSDKTTNFTFYKIRFAFSNLKKYYNDELFMHPNTRLEFLTTTLTIPTATNATFYNIDRLENEFEDIDLGTLSRDQSVTFNAKLTAEGNLGTSYAKNNQTKNTGGSNGKTGGTQTVYDSQGREIGTVNNSGDFSSSRIDSGSTSSSAAANLKANAEVGYLNSETIKEAVAVKLRRLRTGFNFSDKTLTVAQRGRPLGDISDNIYITATLKITDNKTVTTATAVTFEDLYNKKNEPNSAAKIKYSSRVVNFIRCAKADDLQLSSSYEGAIRAVRNEYLKPGSNALEYDDKVTFYKISGSSANPISIDKNLYCKEVFNFKIIKDDGTKYTLKIATNTIKEVGILNDESPEMFFQWLNYVRDNPSINNLSDGNFWLYFENNIDENDKIYIIKPVKMTAAEIKIIKDLGQITAVKRGD